MLIWTPNHPIWHNRVKINLNSKIKRNSSVELLLFQEIQIFHITFTAHTSKYIKEDLEVAKGVKFAHILCSVQITIREKNAKT
jgi:hypothetical protein